MNLYDASIILATAIASCLMIRLHILCFPVFMGVNVMIAHAAWGSWGIVGGQAILFLVNIWGILDWSKSMRIGKEYMDAVEAGDHEPGPDHFCCAMRARFIVGIVGQRRDYDDPTDMVDYISDWCPNETAINRDRFRKYRSEKLARPTRVGDEGAPVVISAHYCSFCGAHLPAYAPRTIAD